ncbi:MAG: HyaD/HybD family hydrogenase maturation endopeptidase [Nitrospirota bacterium]
MIYDTQKQDVLPVPPKVLILGVGNLLLTDDGFGVHVIHSLNDVAFPNNIQCREAGTVSHALLPLFHDVDLLLIVDVVLAGAAPGSIFRFSPEDIQAQSKNTLSLHQISLLEVLQMAALTGKKPKTIILAVQPEDVSSWSMELTDELKPVLPKVRQLIFDELTKALAW